MLACSLLTGPPPIWSNDAASRRLRWRRRDIFGGGGDGWRERDSGTFGLSGSSSRFWWDGSRGGSWVDRWGLSSTGDAGVVGEEPVGRHAEVRHELDQQLVPAGHYGSERRDKYQNVSLRLRILVVQDSKCLTVAPGRRSISQSGGYRLALRRWRTPRSQSDSRYQPRGRTCQMSPGWPGTHRKEDKPVFKGSFEVKAAAEGRLTLSGSTVTSQEQLVPGGYFLSGQLGVLISPWDFVIFPPQTCWSKESNLSTWRSTSGSV